MNEPTTIPAERQGLKKMTETTILINNEEIESTLWPHFNWHNFETGEAVYLDDIDGTDFLVARFKKVETAENGDRVVRLVALDRLKNRKSYYQRMTVNQ